MLEHVDVNVDHGALDSHLTFLPALTCSTGAMSQEGQVGIEKDLSRVRIKALACLIYAFSNSPYLPVLHAIA